MRRSKTSKTICNEPHIGYAQVSVVHHGEPTAERESRALIEDAAHDKRLSTASL